MAIIKLNVTERRRLTLFIICLFAATFCWLFFALSNRYTYTVSTKVHYTNFPANKAFYPLQSDSVKLLVEGTGWQLLINRMEIGLPYVSVDLENLNRRNFVAIQNQLSSINEEIRSAQRIISIFPDSLFFDFSTRTAKKVPVLLAHDIRFAKQFNLAGSIKCSPAYVNVTGPAESLKNIKFWATDSLKLDKLSSSVSRKITLKSSPQSNISVYPNIVEVNIPVEEFTEKTVDVPIEVVNNKDYQVMVIPQKVKITFHVPLSNYSKVDKDLFEAVIDLKTWSEKKYTQLPVQIAYSPEFCKIVRIEPQTVDFILQ